MRLNIHSASFKELASRLAWKWAQTRKETRQEKTVSLPHDPVLHDVCGSCLVGFLTWVNMEGLVTGIHSLQCNRCYYTRGRFQGPQDYKGA